MSETESPDLAALVREREAADRRHKSLVSDIVREVLRADAKTLPAGVLRARAQLVAECVKVIQSESRE